MKTAADLYREWVLNWNTIDMLRFIQRIQNEALEHAAEIAMEHSCPSYHELCDCRSLIAGDIRDLIKKPNHASC